MIITHNGIWMLPSTFSGKFQFHNNLLVSFLWFKKNGIFNYVEMGTVEGHYCLFFKSSERLLSYYNRKAHHTRFCFYIRRFTTGKVHPNFIIQALFSCLVSSTIHNMVFHIKFWTLCQSDTPKRMLSHRHATQGWRLISFGRWI